MSKKYFTVSIIFLVLLIIIIAQSVWLFKLHHKTVSPALPVKKISLNKAEPSSGKKDDSLKGLFFQDNYNPFAEMQRMHERMDQMFQDSLGRFRSDSGFSSFFDDSFFSPDADINDAGDKYVIKFDLPGLEKNEIDVSLEGRVLTVAGKRAEEKKDQSDTMFRQERYAGSFQRSITLPGSVKESTMKAEYVKGVLIITVEKKKGVKESKIKVH